MRGTATGHDSSTPTPGVKSKWRFSGHRLRTPLHRGDTFHPTETVLGSSYWRDSSVPLDSRSRVSLDSEKGHGHPSVRHDLPRVPWTTLRPSKEEWTSASGSDCTWTIGTRGTRLRREWSRKEIGPSLERFCDPTRLPKASRVSGLPCSGGLGLR